MARHRYKFNPELLKYDVVKITFRDRFFKGFTYLLASIVVSVAYYIVFSIFFDTPEVKNLKRENSNILSHYGVLNERFRQVEDVLEDIEQRDNNIYRTIFAAEPIDQTIRTAGFGGSDRYRDYENLANAEIVSGTALRLDKVTKRIYIQSKSFDEVVNLAKNKEEMLACVPAIQPVSNIDLKRIASGFGMRIHPFYKVIKKHKGIDFTAPMGTEIYATGKGVVEEARYSNGGYGYMIKINHDFGYHTLYAHMSELKVHKGQKIKRGQVIGYVGSSGMSVAPHLHYEVHKNNEAIDPVNYFFNDLTAEQYQQIIHLAATNGQTFD